MKTEQPQMDKPRLYGQEIDVLHAEVAQKTDHESRRLRGLTVKSNLEESRLENNPLQILSEKYTGGLFMGSMGLMLGGLLGGGGIVNLNAGKPVPGWVGVALGLCGVIGGAVKIRNYYSYVIRSTDYLSKTARYYKQKAGLAGLVDLEDKGEHD